MTEIDLSKPAVAPRFLALPGGEWCFLFASIVSC